MKILYPTVLVFLSFFHVNAQNDYCLIDSFLNYDKDNLVEHYSSNSRLPQIDSINRTYTFLNYDLGNVVAVKFDVNWKNIEQLDIIFTEKTSYQNLFDSLQKCNNKKLTEKTGSSSTYFVMGELFMGYIRFEEKKTKTSLVYKVSFLSMPF